MLWDVSWDQNNVIGGQRYSEYAFKELGGITVPPTKGPSQAPPALITTQASPAPVTTKAPASTTRAPPRPTGKLRKCSQNNLLLTRTTPSLKV